MPYVVADGDDVEDKYVDVAEGLVQQARCAISFPTAILRVELEDGHAGEDAGAREEGKGRLEDVERVTKVVVLVRGTVYGGELSEERAQLGYGDADVGLHALDPQQGLEQQLGAVQHLVIREGPRLEVPRVERRDELTVPLRRRQHGPRPGGGELRRERGVSRTG